MYYPSDAFDGKRRAAFKKGLENARKYASMGTRVDLDNHCGDCAVSDLVINTLIGCVFVTNVSRL